MKTNIVLMGFFKDLTKQISEKLALDYDLYFADVEGMLEYNLINEKEIEKLCGISYLNGLKQKVLRDISTYENTLIYMPYSIFSERDNYKMFRENCTVVFLNFTRDCLEEKIKQTENEDLRKAREVFFLAYEERTEFCKENSDVTIDINEPKLESSYKRVRKYIDNYYL